MIYLNLLAVGVLLSSLPCPAQVSRNSCLTGTPGYDILLWMPADRESSKQEPPAPALMRYSVRTNT